MKIFINIVLLLVSIDVNASMLREMRLISKTDRLIINKIKAEMPELENGDLIFQNLRSAMAPVIKAASKSDYTHVGIIVKRSDGTYVMEAIGPVKYTKLERYINQGRGKYVAIYRHPKVANSAKLQRSIIKAAKQDLGKPYDILYYWGDSKIYCSELVYDAYEEGANIKLGTPEDFKDLDMEHPKVQFVIRQLWRSHPSCNGITKYKECYKILQEEDIISPVELTRDDELVKIYSNFPE